MIACQMSNTMKGLTLSICVVFALVKVSGEFLRCHGWSIASIVCDVIKNLAKQLESATLERTFLGMFLEHAKIYKGTRV